MLLYCGMDMLLMNGACTGFLLKHWIGDKPLAHGQLKADVSSG